MAIRYNLFLTLFLFAKVFSYYLNENDSDFGNAVNKSVDYLERLKTEYMIPGIVAGISLNGDDVWTGAFGQTDIENEVKTRVDSVWRLASISKSLTTALVGRLMEKGLMDLEKPIHHYLKPNVFTVKEWNQKNVSITVGQVMSHTAGLSVTNFPEDLYHNFTFENVSQTLVLFKDDPLLSEPGTQFNYSNNGFQVVGAIIESVLNETYEKAINRMFAELGMNSTLCERHEQIIPKRSRYYMRSDSVLAPQPNRNSGKVELLNTALADDLVSAEAMWPAGGIVSTVADLLRFGRHMIDSFKGVNHSNTLNPSTVKQLWAPVIRAKLDDLQFSHAYAHGWAITTPNKPIVCQNTNCKTSPIKQIVWHTGGMAGVNTLLLLCPEQDIAVTIFANTPISTTDEDRLFEAGLEIVKNFIG